MRKFTSVFLAVAAMVTISTCAMGATKYNIVNPKAPYISPALKPCIAKYRAGNYTGAMIDLEELLKKEKTNTYAKYYLALCYTKLGFESDAVTVYNEIIEKNRNDSLTYYSKRALACLSDPESEGCKPQKLPQGEARPEGDDDISKFIYSGKTIHPAAMDIITKERMEIKLQQEEYSKNNGPTGPLSYSAPTNEEIAYALNTLAKIGINPFSQNNMISSTGLDYNYMPAYNGLNAGYRNLDQMLLYNQLDQQKNNFINYGI